MIQQISDLQTSVSNLASAVSAAISAGIGQSAPPSGTVLGADDLSALSSMKSTLDGMTSSLTAATPVPVSSGASVSSSPPPVTSPVTQASAPSGDATNSAGGPPRS